MAVNATDFTVGYYDDYVGEVDIYLLDENNELVPAAAEKWESDVEGKKWIFYLRKDARWSDGREVTAFDFEYSFRRMLDPSSGNIYAFLYYVIKNGKAFNQGNLKEVAEVGIRAIDTHTLEILTEGPCPYLPYIVSFITSSLNILFPSNSPLFIFNLIQLAISSAFE